MIKGIPINPALEKALPKFEAGFFQNNRADTPTDTPRASAESSKDHNRFWVAWGVASRRND